ncbi:MAG: 2-oxoglutarate dehydrogenase E1 component [Kordiimonas sp.]|nr:2-oxoglutarate dehydrogenase E1 component [Kordiimonas sp.]
MIMLNGSSGEFVESLFERYLENPGSVDPSWQTYFAELAQGAQKAVSRAQAEDKKLSDWHQSEEEDLLLALDPGLEVPKAPAKKKDKAATVEFDEKELRANTLDSIRLLMMIRAYRVRGHLKANLDPLGLTEPEYHPELDPATYGFSEADMDRPIFIDNVLGLETATVREVLSILDRTYCSTVGVEFMHIFEPDEKAWIQGRIEGRDKEIHFTNEGKTAIMQKLIEAENFEQFLARKYIGTKRFGLDGGEALIPALEAIVKTGGQMGVKEIVIGMSHRGRLNVLTNFMKKPFRAIFHEFHGGSYKPEDVEGSGDVKYHLGTSADREFDGNLVHLSLTPNPSHLEAVDPVALGKARAKMMQRHDRDGESVLTLLMHGDAAFAGQGLVAECFDLSGLRGYRTGGTVHVVVNNQIGFTTAPHFSRTSPYCSDIAKSVQAPIFHVNGDDPEAVVYAMKVATEFRQIFKKDVVVDMICYRRFGHNEGDEPAFTQPLMYKRIKNHPFVSKIYTERLAAEGVLGEADVDHMRREFNAYLEGEMDAAANFKPEKADWLEGEWSGVGVARDSGTERRADTGVDIETLKEMGKVLTEVPDNLEVHRTLRRVLAAKEAMFDKGEGFDWATAEALAFSTLIKEGYRVRLSGQDSERGTFSHRHSVWVDQNTERRYTPMATIEGPHKRATYEVHNSALSEAGVLGYEYGYSLAEPNALVLWEGQFGDFANGAQVIIDQFISSAEHKWLRMSGLVMLLPHGYEGQGPEHSSARLERYLQLCAEDNLQVANCTTPANYYHILRRQMHRSFRKPLILMTPKSLLRHKKAVSSLEEMGPGSQFHRVLWDSAESHPHQVKVKLKSDDKIKRVVLCSGKVYYDLLEERDQRDQRDTYILRVEQLYPYPNGAIVHELKRFTNLETVVWCQEEPRNMGAWSFIEPYIEESLSELDVGPQRPLYAGRKAAAAPATGLMSRHIQQQEELVDQALSMY